MVQEYFTVSELNNLIKDVLQAGFPRPVWVCGEIQQFNRNKLKKHVFFELVEKDVSSQDIQAKIGLVIFGGRRAFIENKFREVDQAFALKDDIEVKFACRVDFYAPHGAVRLIVEDIDPAYTLGKLALEKQKLILQLKSKGIFEMNKRIGLPLVPLNIGLITAYDSAAYNDFISEIAKSGMAFRIYIRNSLMQGKKAEQDICQALKELQRIKGLDLLVITRGGGSLAELSCFDSQPIAETIARSALPVLSGIGHEINLTITDMAAHTYAKTPTAVAQFIVEKVREYLLSLDQKQNDLIELTQTIIMNRRDVLRQKALQLYNQTSMFLKVHKQRFAAWNEFFKYNPLVYVKNKNKDIQNFQANLKRNAKVLITQYQKQLGAFQKMIDFVHPRNTLKRGFSIVRREDGEFIKSVDQLKPKERVKNEFYDGSSYNIVEEIIKEE